MKTLILSGNYPSKDIIDFARDPRLGAPTEFTGSDLQLLQTHEQVYVEIYEDDTHQDIILAAPK